MTVRDLWIKTKVVHSLTDSEVGQMHFLEALNGVRTDINMKFRGAFTEVTSTDISSNTELSWGAHLDNAVRAGLKHYLIIGGAYASDPDPQVEPFYHRQLQRAMVGAIRSDGDQQTRLQPETAV
jgi:hypothetical protein